MKEYARLIEELHIVVLSPRGFELQVQISPNCFAYSTNSINRFLRPIDAVKIGEKIKCDLITTQDPFECGWVGLQIKKKKGVPLEVQLHTDPSSPHFSGFLNWLRKRIMKQVMRSADSVRDVASLPIYVDRERIKGEPKFDLHTKYGFKTVCLMVSRLTKEKNIGLALEAFKEVRKKFPDTWLVVVGSGPEKFEAQRNVVFVGWQEDLVSYYKTADVFIQTSKFEGYGLSLVEAGLSGLQVVSTPVGVATKLKNVFIAKTAHEFAEAIESAIKAPKLGLKQELEARVLTKEAYLAKIKENWEKTAIAKR